MKGSRRGSRTYMPGKKKGGERERKKRFFFFLLFLFQGYKTALRWNIHSSNFNRVENIAGKS